ncbi:hypothetical protein KX928_07375 [Roseobacter sp. YSTF-M11]|uniref:Uncharacterized protein n=1 Tax=Roseobacter insulae TaxID=2859783 RepID=A0A9X1FTN8_9RHOB|nr:hypothetical protein [Roseobacter insulae]MBW4707604.1 hypothetical protein [Roseobacter insulae]
MSYSAAEISALATKAARGAGAPPEQAARFGRASVVHLAQNRAVEMLTDALDALPGGVILWAPLAVDRALSSLADDPAGARVEARGHPALVQSYLEASPHGIVIERVDTDAFDISVTAAATGTSVPPVRLSDCDRCIAVMTTLAARTFVPESAASRLGGAGAGLTDND